MIAMALGGLLGLLIGWWLGRLRPRPAPWIDWQLTWPNAQSVRFTAPIPDKETTTMAVVKLLPNQQVGFTVLIKDAQGNPARVQDPGWQIEGPLTVTEANPPVAPPQAPGAPGTPTHPIAPGGERPTQPIAPGGEQPTHPIAPGGPPPRPTHPIAPQVDPRTGKPRAGEPYHATVQSGSETGAGNLTFSCDADLGEGTKPLIATAAIVVASGEAVVVELVPGEPQDITPSTPKAKPAAAASKR
jgi:hypothetical protein